MPENFLQPNNFENKRVNFELDIEGVKIPCWKEDFSYPENIQNETQIEGYEKIKIERKMLENSNVKFLELLKSFSRNKFPNTTYNHVLYGDHPYPTSDTGKDVHEKFAKEGFLLGKIDTIEPPDINPNYIIGSNTRTAKLLINENNEVELFGQMIHAPKTKNVTFFKYTGETSKKDLGFADEYDFEKGITLFNDEEYKNVLKHKIFIDSVNGLNIAAGDKVWSGNFSRPIFGFDPQESPFKEYLQKINDLYEKLPDNMVGKVNKECVRLMLNNNAEKFHDLIKIGHPFLPIMTGNTGLPELRWGHCKYAVIPTVDSINLLTIKHVEK